RCRVAPPARSPSPRRHRWPRSGHGARGRTGRRTRRWWSASSPSPSIIFHFRNMSTPGPHRCHRPWLEWSPASKGAPMARRIATTFSSLLLLTLLGIAAAQAELPSAPGDLVDVGGHSLHIYCQGEGSPTVVLEAGLGDGSINFRALQDRLARHTRTCAYDRAGYGWSEPGPAPRDLATIAAELDALLDGAGEAGPYVLAGHSIGGLYALG